ncbi:HlyD family secretion protein [Bradyrhizobium erythrophlei]|jgi:membrane fusion protein (multidrug efflux system)|uniref:Membrane fusion protein, multidrug efflux system n=1 Tax=Bradyrhizobium erythrophlei TaxID=1437360 RepID=A0A1M7TXQ8_9BRAD|nr:HlyD family secretion protein [Bradyrhizobium erythrophlei]SHN75514.1 membrane fusion protein, multidrug efflux system [Bradyrhizobium erythrophlei]
MADPVLKFPPEQKGAPGQPPREKLAGTPRRRLLAALRRYRRFLLLVVLPIVAVIGGVVFYLNGGRYVGTDDTYVGAQKVLITPDISGRIDKVVVKEGQLVHKGDVLFEIDPIPFRLTVDRAKAAVEQARTSYSNLVANIKIYDEMANLMQQAIDLKQRDVERKSALVKNSYGSQLDLDNSTNSAITVRAELAFVQQQRSSSLTQLLGNPNLKLDDFPPYYQAQAALAQAQRDLDHTEMRAPMDGIATLVDQIQLGRFVVAGSPVFTIIDVAKPWVDSNLKESDLTHVAVGQTVEIDVDAFPDHTFKGTIGSLSPGTGAQFAILPPQNATGNFVKVVQRVPVRIYFDANDPMIKKLKAGMSAYATIDTGHKRTLAGLFGIRSAAAKQDQD